MKIRQPISCMQKLGKIFSRKFLLRSEKSGEFSRYLRNVARVKRYIKITGLCPCDVPIITSFLMRLCTVTMDMLF